MRITDHAKIWRHILLVILIILGVSVIAWRVYSKQPSNIHEARYYDKLPGKKVLCRLCPWQCQITSGELGFCRARKNVDGILYALGYGTPCSLHIDPIEKKPFFNYYPATAVFSIASAGCNLRCKFCQNWEISQVSPLDTDNYSLSPADMVNQAIKEKCKVIAYTYSEPTNFYEYMLDICKMARKRGLKNVYHSNGYINPAPLKELCPYLDAANIDLKGFNEEYYVKMCGAHLQPVLDTLVILREKGVWLEITNLIIPQKNDQPETIRKMCQWIVTNLGPDVPIHFSRFYPSYQLKNVSPTPIKTLEMAREIAIKEGLKYVYIGNVVGHPGENTYCPKCHKAIIKRVGYTILEMHLNGGACSYCGETIAGRWDS
ncbi:MAG: AmmeMemoRadiSam system radical SAM enzyme [bacterium]|nr:AmmeMemoRadiSam system radical SAM enzyme [bacterium]